jgi:hypothetical protein
MTEFTGFVILAGMRTGSNLLEQLMRQMPGVVSHGELFNPGFIGRDKVTSYRGISLNDRERDPLAVLQAMRSADPDMMHGFRFFQDHDPRILDHVLKDRRVAKIILTRDPVASYLSWKAARADGRWRIGNPLKRRAASLVFEPREFAKWEAASARFLAEVEERLRHLGQTAFRLDFDDLTEVRTLRGLASWLGREAAGLEFRPVTARQNRDELRNSVRNQEDLPAAAPVRSGRRDHAFSLPDRVQSCGNAAFAPLPGDPCPPVAAWLQALRPRPAAGRPITFALVRHPLVRAWSAFRQTVLSPDVPEDAPFRLYLGWNYQINLPGRRSNAHLARAFEAFLVFLGDNLAGETSQPVNPLWARQEDLLAAAARRGVIHLVGRRDAWPEAADWVAAQSGMAGPAADRMADGDAASLSPVIRESMNKLVRAAYAGDFAAFGWDDLDQAACEAGSSVRMA